jgi:probable HAF family extracellular repeat protein
LLLGCACSAGRLGACLLLLLVPATAGNAAPQFIPLGVPNTSVTSMSADGTVFVGSTPTDIFRWTETGGYQRLGPIATVGQVAVSADGGTIVSTVRGTDGIQTASVWAGGTSWRSLGGFPDSPPLDGSLSSGYGVSGNGSVVVGLGWLPTGRGHAFRWEGSTGMVDLGSLTPGRSSRANAVSADGRVIVGWDDAATGYRRGAVWRDGREMLLDPSGQAGEALAVNSNGSLIVGVGYPGNTQDAYLWSATGGFVDLGMLPGGDFDRATAYALSDDGSVVVGFSGFGFDRNGFLWTPATGMLSLDSYLRDQGVDLTGWQLTSPLAVSADGTTLAGWGIHAGGVEGWVVRLQPTAVPEPSPIVLWGLGGLGALVLVRRVRRA